MKNTEITPSGILLINKPKGKTSFSLVSALRRLYGVKKIGHAGTLDPFATGVMIMLIGREYTRLSNQFLCQDKEYLATLHLGVQTDTFDSDGAITAIFEKIPSQAEIDKVLEKYQGTIEQIPPMFSAKKVQGKKLYELARKGIIIDRKPEKISLTTKFLSYEYPFLKLHICCSKGTYIRSIAEEIGKDLCCGAHLSDLERTRCGPYPIANCIDGKLLFESKEAIPVLMTI